MTDKEAIDIIRRYECNSEHFEACEMAIQALEYDDAKYHEEHGEVIVDKDVWEDVKKALEVVNHTDVTDTNVGNMIDYDRNVKLNDRINDLINAIENDECQYWTISKIISALKKLPSVTQIDRYKTELNELDRAVSLNAVIKDIKELSEWHDGQFTADRVINHLRQMPPQDSEVVWRGNNFNTITVKKDGE